MCFVGSKSFCHTMIATRKVLGALKAFAECREKFLDRVLRI